VRTPALIDGGKYGKILQSVPPEDLKKMVDRQHPISAEQFAQRALRAVAKNRAIIVIPSWWKLVWWLYRFSPSLGFYLGRKGMAVAMKSLKG
jgi:short-subunit dehydrogenase